MTPRANTKAAMADPGTAHDCTDRGCARPGGRFAGSNRGSALRDSSARKVETIRLVAARVGMGVGTPVGDQVGGIEGATVGAHVGAREGEAVRRSRTLKSGITIMPGSNPFANRNDCIRRTNAADVKLARTMALLPHNPLPEFSSQNEALR